MHAVDDLDLPQPVWRTSTYSNNGGNCVEVAERRSGGVAIRDSKDPDGPGLAFAETAWAAFTLSTKDV